MIYSLNKGLKQIALLVLFLLLFIPQHVNASILADTIDDAASSMSLGAFFDYASGQEGQYSKLQRTNSTESLKKGQDELFIVQAGFSNLQEDGSINQITAEQELQVSAQIEPAIIGEALCYPNPFRFNSEMGAEIGYTLSKDMEIEFRVYNMLGQLIVKRTFSKGAEFAQGTPAYNKIKLNKNSLDGHILSTGVYFYYIINEGEILARGKMAVKP